MAKGIYKDKELVRLANAGYNIAQFFSVAPAGFVQEIKIRGSESIKDCDRDEYVRDLIALLFKKSGEQRINVRSWHPSSPSGHPFVYGLTTVEEVFETIEKRMGEGLHCLVHETFDVHDGGLPGIIIAGDTVEIIPEGTPRDIETEDAFSMPYYFGLEFIRIVTGVNLGINYNHARRLECSIHPKTRGFLNKRTVFWEISSQTTAYPEVSKLEWPNSYSKYIGDKAFGLLVADALGLLVPYTEIYFRKKNPEVICFGNKTITNTVWTRTCPAVSTPGKFSTIKSTKVPYDVVDPVELMLKDDPKGEFIPTCLIQDGVPAVFSGAAITKHRGGFEMEGVKGEGDAFMMGKKTGDPLPKQVQDNVYQLWSILNKWIKNPSFEWVYDGKAVWVVQLRCNKDNTTDGKTIVKGAVKKWVPFSPSCSLDALRVAISSLGENEGIVLTSPVGITSHFADVLRETNTPSRIKG